MSSEHIKGIIQASADLKLKVMQDEHIIGQVQELADMLIQALKAGNQIYTCGNGGSAADAMHLAAEFTGRFYINRKALPAEFLNANDAAMTAIANDYGYEQVFARMVEAKMKKGDVLWAFSTSGNSKNILLAIDQATRLDAYCAGFTGQDGGLMNGNCDLLLKIPSTDTPRIQEMHMLLGHIICEMVEKAFQ
jgi:D-sedoheptulose 7-phosphate isomerase